MLAHLPYSTLESMIELTWPAEGVDCDLAQIYPDSMFLKEAERRGHEIGSHGHRHLHRNTITTLQLESELQQSVDILSKALGKKDFAFSHPYGAFKSGDQRIILNYFSQAATCERSFVREDTDPLCIGRFSWPGNAKNQLRFRRWLLTGRI